MRWLADECVAARLVNRLREDGHDVLYVAEIAAGLSDVDVINLARRDNRVLLTEDKDFGDLVFRRSWAVHGIVLMRVNSQSLQAARLVAAVEQYGERLVGHYVVVEDGRLRARRLRSTD